MDSALLDVLQQKKPQTLLVLGASDTGKTALIEQFLATWDPGDPIAVVDCDVGQSHLGPPTTIGWGLVTGAFSGWSRVALRQMAFIGSVSPEGALETFLQATARMVQAAKEAAGRLIVDTTGLVSGELGMTLKRRKAQLIKPDLILAIQRDNELEPMLDALPGDIPIERLRASTACVRRGLTERAAYRDRQFARYFANSAKQVLALDRLKLVGLGPDWPDGRVVLSLAALIDRVVSLRTESGDDLALGLVRDVSVERNTLAVFSPLRDASAVRTLAVGSLRWPTSSGEVAKCV